MKFKQNKKQKRKIMWMNVKQNKKQKNMWMKFKQY